MSKMNFNMQIEDPKKEKPFPWLALILLLVAAGIAAWLLEPVVAGMLQN